ncbi:MAG: GNAT family N-acetyltransferase [Granulosicoccus sp.]
MDSLTLRPARVDDAELIWIWRNCEDAYKYYKNPHRQTLEDHTRWLGSAINDSRRSLWMIDDDDQPVSHVRFDYISERVVSVSIVVDPSEYGKAIGKRSLSLALESKVASGESINIIAEIHTENIASRKLFEAAGFKRHSECDPFLSYMLSLPLTTST